MGTACDNRPLFPARNKQSKVLTYQIHNADNPPDFATILLTMAQEQTSDAANFFY